jgi:hypothetical protein
VREPAKYLIASHEYVFSLPSHIPDPTRTTHSFDVSSPFQRVSHLLIQKYEPTGVKFYTSRNQRPVEDTVNEARLRQLRAHEAAVDMDQVLIYTHASSPRVCLADC